MTKNILNTLRRLFTRQPTTPCCAVAPADLHPIKDYAAGLPLTIEATDHTQQMALRKHAAATLLVSRLTHAGYSDQLIRFAIDHAHDRMDAGDSAARAIAYATADIAILRASGCLHHAH